VWGRDEAACGRVCMEGEECRCDGMGGEDDYWEGWGGRRSVVKRNEEREGGW
jgi:hypothetical protein